MEPAERAAAATNPADSDPTPSPAATVNASSPSPPVALAPSVDFVNRKRKYEEATADEKYELFLYASANPHLKQRELAEWFAKTYGKAINQSTVSRNLKRFKKEPPTKPAAGSPPAGRRRERKPSKPAIQNPPGTQFISYQNPRAKQQTLDEALYSFYSTYRRRNTSATISEISENLKAEALKILANSTREETDKTMITDEWIENWQRKHSFLPPSPSSSSSGSPSPPPSSSADSVRKGDRSPGHNESGIASEQTRPERRPPPVTLPPTTPRDMHPPTPSVHTASRQLSPVGFIKGSEESSRKMEIRRLKKDIEKRDKQILKAKSRKEKSAQRLEELERMEAVEGAEAAGRDSNQGQGVSTTATRKRE